MYELTPLFLFKFQFMAELIVAESLVAHRFKRRPLFWLRLPLCIAACFGVAYAIPVLAYNAWFCSALFIALFAVTLAMMPVCFDEKPSAVIFGAIAGYTVQHIAYVLFDILILITKLNKGLPLGTYGEVSFDISMTSGGGMSNVGAVFASNNLLAIVMWVFVYFEVYWLFYMLSSYRLKKVGAIELKSKSVFLVVALILVVDVLVSSFVTYYSKDNFQSGYLYILYGYNVFGCLLALYIQFELAVRKKLETDYNTVNMLWSQREEQYRLSKENIARIDMKCHDLKHQIRTIGNRAAINGETLGEIENAIAIYDSAVKTGNEALDVILTEKSLLCNERKIKLACIADGKSLGFMSDADLYSLFGNLVDNALESACKCKENERDVSLTIKRVKNFLSVNIHNRYCGELLFEKGLPITTKDDKYNHGFGMKSVVDVCKKYGGELKITATDGIFNLNILFPIPSV